MWQQCQPAGVTDVRSYVDFSVFLQISVESITARDPDLRDRKAYEEDEFGRIWQADTCYLPHITMEGQTRRVYCIMIIDDHSRLLVGGELFYNDNAYSDMLQALIRR